LIANRVPEAAVDLGMRVNAVDLDNCIPKSRKISAIRRLNTSPTLSFNLFHEVSLSNKFVEQWLSRTSALNSGTQSTWYWKTVTIKKSRYLRQLTTNLESLSILASNMGTSVFGPFNLF